MVVSPAVMYGLSTVALTKRPEAKLEMLRFSLSVTRMDRIHGCSEGDADGWRDRGGCLEWDEMEARDLL